MSDTVSDMIRRRQGDDHTAIVFEDQRWTWEEHVFASATRAAIACEWQRPGPFHIGYLLENIPETSFWLGAGALAGATMVGINPTRRGAELATDIRHTDCQLVVTEQKFLPLLEGADIGVARERILVVESDSYTTLCTEHHTNAPPDRDVAPDSIALLVFTSGTTGAPKAAMVSQRRFAMYGRGLSETQGLTAESVCYLVMPMFHSNALYAGWSPAVYAGATIALRRRFSASAFIDDVRRYGVTYFNYVGKPLSYILATPPRPDDRDNTLTLVLGNEGTEHDVARFSERFGVPVTDSYGSTEGGMMVRRSPEQPAGALGLLPEGALVVDPETGEPRPPAQFDAKGRLVNSEECIGEIVNTGRCSFEGYYKNDDAVRVRTRNGWYWSGDLGYVDADGWLYFAGRDFDWLRVDGENFAAAPIERVLSQFPGVVLGVVYAVPAPDVGDDVMAALQLTPGTAFDAEAFDSFLAQHADLGVKWTPRYVRIALELPMTATAKVVKRELRAARWECADPVWWRPRRGDALRLMDPADVSSLREEFESGGRTRELETR
ncbi:MAG TPA: AMP-binding protein [Acidimicrobiia bacterium]|nr:AMP-binding protein [Acidimicrobiia bacterium]